MSIRQFVTFPFTDLTILKEKVLHWVSRYGTFSYLDNQEYSSGELGYECLAAAGEKFQISLNAGRAFESLKIFSEQHQDWLFGHFSFDLKSETEYVSSNLPDPIGFPDLFFFVPEIILLIRDGKFEIGLFGDDHWKIWKEIESVSIEIPTTQLSDQHIHQRISRNNYLKLIHQLQGHILRGDCYEINFCQEFFAKDVQIDPLQVYEALRRISPSPFSAFYSTGHKFLLCASPERYLKKEENRIFSQPIKGTAARDPVNPDLDERLKNDLSKSEKDQAENVMVVDLVRNDLSKICETDSVKVDELFGIYSFPQVHQMISTISGRPKPGLHWTEMISKTFPMGSMTGAPKKRVLELIEKYEKTKRGLFSGALGYVKPGLDFDFNVVIRSILYNRLSAHLSFFAGSGITMNSDPEKEYEECLVKVGALEKIIKNPSAV